MVLPFLMTCALTMGLAALTGRKRALWLPLAFGIFVVVVGSNNPYGVTGTALRVGFWMVILTAAAGTLIVLRRRLPAMIRARG